MKTLELKRITAMEIARVFVHNRVYVCSAPKLLISMTGKQFTAKLFLETCQIFHVKNQKNGQIERFNRTIFAALRHYVSDHPRDWILFTDSLTYAYNSKFHENANLAPFYLVLSRRLRPSLWRCILESSPPNRTRRITLNGRNVSRL